MDQASSGDGIQQQRGLVLTIRRMVQGGAEVRNVFQAFLGLTELMREHGYRLA
jgi:hypothetical protein